MAASHCVTLDNALLSLGHSLPNCNIRRWGADLSLSSGADGTSVSTLGAFFGRKAPDSTETGAAAVSVWPGGMGSLCITDAGSSQVPRRRVLIITVESAGCETAFNYVILPFGLLPQPHTEFSRLWLCQRKWTRQEAHAVLDPKLSLAVNIGASQFRGHSFMFLYFTVIKSLKNTIINVFP